MNVYACVGGGGGGGGGGSEIMLLTVTIYFINPSGKLKLSFDRTTKNMSQIMNHIFILFLLFLFYLCNIDIICPIWECVLFASTIRIEILLLLTLTHNLCDDVCETQVWIYNDFKCLLCVLLKINLRA